MRRFPTALPDPAIAVPAAQNRASAAMPPVAPRHHRAAVGQMIGRRIGRRIGAFVVAVGVVTAAACASPKPADPNLPTPNAGPLTAPPGYSRQTVGPQAFSDYTAVAAAMAPMIESVEVLRIVNGNATPPVAVGLDFATRPGGAGKDETLTTLVNATGGGEPNPAKVTVAGATAAYRRTVNGTVLLYVVGPGEHITVWRGGAGVSADELVRAVTAANRTTSPVDTPTSAPNG